MTPLPHALVVAALAAAAHRWPRRGVRLAQGAAAAVAVAHLLATRRAWELSARRPLWLADAARGRWAERGVDWLLAAAALSVAAALLADPDAPARRVSLVGALGCALLAATATLWAFFGTRG